MRKCRDCNNKVAGHTILCPTCKDAADKRHKAAMLEYQRLRRGSRLPRKCATVGCDETIPRYRTYCDACGKARNRESQRRWHKTHPRRDYKAAIPWYMPPTEATSMKWMEKFKAYHESGMTYAAYQRREMGC